MEWCYAAASVAGSSHTRTQTKLQDAKYCFVFTNDTGDQWFFAVIADGAGSAEFGRQGASIICRAVGSQARKAFRDACCLPDEAAVWSWLDIARDRIHQAANKHQRTARDFAATLVMVMASPHEVVTAHVGDGAIVARIRESLAWTVLSQPHHGEYASTTYFVTDDPQPALRFYRHPNRFDVLAAFSDGIENLVIDSATGEPFAAFFNPMAKPLNASTTIGKDAALCQSLAAFLEGERLNELTDDDRTLIVAVTT
jgi:hypothetical protein